MNWPEMVAQLDLNAGLMGGAGRLERRLVELEDCFADRAAWRAAVEKTNPVVYTVSTFQPVEGAGQLHCGLGVLMPGKVGREYFCTKGHFHAWRAAAEIYLGWRGRGLMLLQDEVTAESRLVPLEPRSVVYVPGGTAHRTINIGTEPLVYLGIYPAEAGHDYEALRRRPFREVVVEESPGKPVLIPRSACLSDSWPDGPETGAAWPV